MRIEVPHTLGKQTARARLDRVAHDLAAREWPGGVEVRDIAQRWTGDRLEFSFAAAQGIFSLSIKGRLDVEETGAALEADVPPMLKMLAGEDRIRTVLQDELRRILAE